MKSFEEMFGGTPQAVGDAPGRVNLLGEHTDYNDGYVLPIAIPQQTRVALRRSSASHFTVYAGNLDRTVTFDWKSPPTDGFATYVFGCFFEARAEGFDVPPLDVHVSSNVPIGVGLSSSAALEVATLRAMRTLLNAPLDDVRLAQVAQRAEVLHAGVRCGIMDQMASSLAGTEQALFLDTRTLQRRLVALPPDSAVLVLDSGIKRSLSGSSFNQRRAECEAAAKQLGVQALRDVSVDELEKLDALDEPLRSRARHVVTENARVLQAVECRNPAAFGALMNASHASLRDDFDVSVPALDRLVALLQAQSQVYGARLTGAGFGGACVALCRSSAIVSVATQALDKYAAEGFSGALLVPPQEAR
ncbi:MAG TPA: galactokinase [Burkholderiaceae bacterium]|nr:galactokinase [Burkholderiaceae bacterium]